MINLPWKYSGYTSKIRDFTQRSLKLLWKQKNVTNFDQHPKYDLTNPSNYVASETPFNKHHFLFECKTFQLLQITLKTMCTNFLSFHYHNSPKISLELLLGKGDTSLEADLEIRYPLCEFLSLPDIQDINPIIKPILA